MSCLFQLDRYIIEEVSVRLNDAYDASISEHIGDIASNIRNARSSKHAQKARLTMEIDVHPTEGKEKSFYPYYVKIKGTAFFTFSEEYPTDQYERALSLNGSSILYGLLRAQIVQLTALSTHGQFLLPTINFVELQQSKSESRAKKMKPKPSKPNTKNIPEGALDRK